MTGRKEKGELKTTSLISDQSVSREIHRNETSPVSLSILYGLSPIQVANVWIANTKYSSTFDRVFLSGFPF